MNLKDISWISALKGIGALVGGKTGMTIIRKRPKAPRTPLFLVFELPFSSNSLDLALGLLVLT